MSLAKENLVMQSAMQASPLAIESLPADRRGPHPTPIKGSFDRDVARAYSTPRLELLADFGQGGGQPICLRD